MKIKFLFTSFLSIIMIITLSITSIAMKERDILDLINEKVDFLERYCAYSESLYIIDRASEQIDLLEHQLLGGMTYIEPFYLARDEFQDYEGFKKMLLTYATPFLTMEYFRYNGPFLNLNGQLYVCELLGGYGEGGFQVNTIETIEQKDNYLTVSASMHLKNGDIWSEETVGLGKYNDSWRIDYIEYTIGIKPSLRNEENVEKVFKDYICNVIRGYLLSDNINCGYKKYSQKAKYFRTLDIVLTEYDLDTCTGSGYAVVEEYDKNGNVVGEHKITVEIGENLSDTVTDEILYFNNPNTSDSYYPIYSGIMTIAVMLLCLFKRNTAR